MPCRIHFARPRHLDICPFRHAVLQPHIGHSFVLRHIEPDSLIRPSYLRFNRIIQQIPQDDTEIDIIDRTIVPFFHPVLHSNPLFPCIGQLHLNHRLPWASSPHPSRRIRSVYLQQFIYLFHSFINLPGDKIALHPQQPVLHVMLHHANVRLPPEQILIGLLLFRHHGHSIFFFPLHLLLLNHFGIKVHDYGQQYHDSGHDAHCHSSPLIHIINLKQELK